MINSYTDLITVSKLQEILYAYPPIVKLNNN